MAIDAIGNSAMTYQGSGLSPDSKVNTQENEAKTQEKISLTSETYAVQDSSATVNKDINQNNESIQKAIDQINKKANNSVVKFGYHEETNRIIIKIIDKDTEKVVQEFPAEKTLDMIAKAWELAGILVDEKR